MANPMARSFLQAVATEEVASPLRVVQMEGLTVLKIIKHCKEFSPALVTGQLLGLDVGSVLEVTNCFPFPIREEDEEIEADGANYQLEMMRYQSTLLGSFQTSELIETFMNYQGHESEREKLVMEKDAVNDELAMLENQLAASEPQINALSQALEEQKSKVSSIKREYDQAESALNLSRSNLKECEQQKLQQQLSDANVERKKMENEVKRMELEQKDCSLKVDKLLEKYGWIAAEKQSFGKSGTDYDFTSFCWCDT